MQSPLVNRQAPQLQQPFTPARGNVVSKRVCSVRCQAGKKDPLLLRVARGEGMATSSQRTSLSCIHLRQLL